MVINIGIRMPGRHHRLLRRLFVKLVSPPYSFFVFYNPHRLPTVYLFVLKFLVCDVQLKKKIILTCVTETNRYLHPLLQR